MRKCNDISDFFRIFVAQKENKRTFHVEHKQLTNNNLQTPNPQDPEGHKDHERENNTRAAHRRRERTGMERTRRRMAGSARRTELKSEPPDTPHRHPKGEAGAGGVWGGQRPHIELRPTGAKASEKPQGGSSREGASDRPHKDQ